MRITLALAAAVLLAGCAQGPTATQMTKAQTHSDGECLAALDANKCKFENDLAGGHPVTLAQEP
jgi:hypothetical protein